MFRLENMMNPSLLLLVFCFAGVSLKMADFLGERKTGFLSFLVSAVSAFLFWLLLKDNPETATFMFAVVVGCVLALKVDRLNLVFGLGVLAVLCVFFGFSFPIFWLFILFSLTVVLDEITHEKFVEVGKKGLFFRFRGFFKVLTVVSVWLGWVSLLVAVGFLLFDLSYDLTDFLLTKKF